MKKILFAILAIVIVLGISSPAAASMLIPAADKAKEKAKAPEKSPVIGENWELERIDFIHYAKPDNQDKPSRGPKAPACYKTFGLKWKSFPVDYVINPSNSGLDEEFVKAAILTSAESWDHETSTELFNDSYDVSNSIAYGTQDFINAISFGDYLDERVIGVTTIWYTPRGKQIVEFDIMLNTDYVWGDAVGNSKVMDLQNIATHEIGHGAGLDDIYEEVCSEVTMYGWSDYGETEKRTLEQPDVTGLQKLYGL